jgi:hypothetical protein
MNDFLIDCSIKSYSTSLQFMQRYAILSRTMRHSAGPRIFLEGNLLFSGEHYLFFPAASLLVPFR